MRVLVTGSRTWTDGVAIWTALDIVAKEAFAVGDRLTLVHGACPQGGDEIADRWYRDRVRQGWPVSVERHPAEWTRHGKRAGFLRNQEMTRAGADVCLAFIVAGSRGASMCADLAERAGITVRRFEVS